MLSSERLDAYRSGLDRVSEAAADYVEKRLREAARLHPEMTVAQWRDLAASVMEAAADAYGDMSSELACDLFELQTASLNGSQAAMPELDVGAQADRTARYQAGKLLEGDFEGFVKECSAWASDRARQSANDAISESVERSKRAASRSRSRRARKNNVGVRFARVPQGTETCAFCAMLASRGFVYWSEETAGKFSHFHRGCKCLVVPSTDGAVEGYDPDEWKGNWRSFKEVDERHDLTRNEKDLLKKGIVSGPLLNTRADPALEYFGPAEEDDPQKLAEIKSWLSDNNVEIRISDRNHERIAYSPGFRPGDPGQLIATEGMSLSAWLHEVDHARFDLEKGRPGMLFYLSNVKLREAMEQRAYSIEMEMAKANGYTELERRLENLLKVEIAELEKDYEKD